jgi:hypothetical protein
VLLSLSQQRLHMLGSCLWKHWLPEQLCQPGFPTKDGKAGRESSANPGASFRGQLLRAISTGNQVQIEEKRQWKNKEDKKRRKDN